MPKKEDKSEEHKVENSVSEDDKSIPKKEKNMKIVLNAWFAERASGIFNRFNNATMRAKREEGNKVKVLDVSEHEDEIVTETQYNIQSQLEWQMLLLYPLSVLGTNRVLDTIISRKPLHK